MIEIEFYDTEDGKCPVQEYLNCEPNKVQILQGYCTFL